MEQDRCSTRKKGALREPKATGLDIRRSAVASRPPSIRPHFLSESRYSSKIIFLSAENGHFRNLDSQHSTFRLVLHSPARRMCLHSQRPLLNVLAHQPNLAKMTDRGSSVSGPPWGGSMSPMGASASWCLSWLSVLVCLPQGTMGNGNPDHCQAAWKGKLSWN